MATPQAITAVIRAARPEFRSTADKVAFAVHAILSVNGFSLRKVGYGVDEAAARGAASLPSEEVGVEGWNQLLCDGRGQEAVPYSFLYLPEPGATRQPAAAGQQQHTPLLMLKCLSLTGEEDPGPGGGGEEGGAGAGLPGTHKPGARLLLLVSLADVASSLPPVTLELDVERYAASLTAGAAGYEHLPELISHVQGALDEALDGAKPTTAPSRLQGLPAANIATATTTTTATDKAAAAAATSGRSSEQPPQQPQQPGGPSRGEGAGERRPPERDPLRDDRYPPAGGAGLPGSRRPLGGGDEDLMPGGLPRPPGLGGGVFTQGIGVFGGPEGLVPLGPRGLGGGMHVGPDNPIFAGRLRHPPGGPGFAPGRGGGVPGMRWDPINPEGLQGWSPDDYVRDGRAVRDEGLNDIGRPPPGRGPDWDHMFG